MATTLYATNGYGSPVQQEYDQMVAQKRSAEFRYRQSIDDPELQARFSNHLNINSAGINRSISAPQNPNNFQLPLAQSSLSADYYTNLIPVSTQQPTYTFNDPLEFERNLKNNERQRKLKYLGDLQKQAEEQRQKRERDKRQAQQQINDPPWLRGNPQPKTGVRGTVAWNAVQQTTTVEPESLRRERSLPHDFRLDRALLPPQNNLNNLNNFSTQNAPNQQESAYREALQRQMQERELERQKKRLDEERYNKRLEEEAQVYDPFGKGGGGAPLRDEQGRVIADRGKMLANAYKSQTNIPTNTVNRECSTNFKKTKIPNFKSRNF